MGGVEITGPTGLPLPEMGREWQGAKKLRSDYLFLISLLRWKKGDSTSSLG